MWRACPEGCEKRSKETFNLVLIWTSLLLLSLKVLSICTFFQLKSGVIMGISLICNIPFSDWVLSNIWFDEPQRKDNFKIFLGIKKWKGRVLMCWNIVDVLGYTNILTFSTSLLLWRALRTGRKLKGKEKTGRKRKRYTRREKQLEANVGLCHHLNANLVILSESFDQHR